jgi:uncharacterized phage infection (PIP) family protein YhgE
MNPEDFEKIKSEKAELLAQLEEAKLAYQKSLDELDKQKDAVEQAARNYRVLVNKVEADLHEVPEELRKVWEAEDKAAKAASDRDQAIDAIQEGLSQVSKGITALGNKLGDTLEKFGDTIRGFSEDEEEREKADSVEAEDKHETKAEASSEQKKSSKRIVIKLEEPKRAGAIEPPYKQGDPHR